MPISPLYILSTADLLLAPDPLRITFTGPSRDILHVRSHGIDCVRDLSSTLQSILASMTHHDPTSIALVRKTKRRGLRLEEVPASAITQPVPDRHVVVCAAIQTKPTRSSCIAPTRDARRRHARERRRR
ncbi:hypothetical protein PMIN03_002120 [Paraphaeosphaeria minitans]